MRTRKVRYTDHSRWVGLPHYMTRCAAWAAALDKDGKPLWRPISPNAKALFIEVWKRYNGINNGAIAYSVREAAAIGLSRSTADRAFDELIARGFLVVARSSGFNVKTRESRLWRVTALPTTSTPATNDFMKWSPQPSPEKNLQSHQRDAQSHQRDCDPKRAIKELVTVSPVGLSEGSDHPSQSHQRDTSNYHEGSGETEASRSSSRRLPNPTTAPKRIKNHRRPIAAARNREALP